MGEHSAVFRAGSTAVTNLINAERLSIAFGTRIVLDNVSIGLSSGDVVGVVGRNGDGKTTLLDLLTGARLPDSGQVVRANALSLGYLSQVEQVAPGASVRDVIVHGEPDHVWASEPQSRLIVTHFLAGIDLDAPVATLSGGERRRVALTALLLGHHDLLVLDEPTNHLDIEAVAWLANHLTALQARGVAMLVVSHDRWFLDAICTRVWEVHDATIDAYDGGYSAYVLARAERVRQAAANEARRQNLLRKELAWLRRGPPARTSKPKFRIDAANALIEDVPEPRDRMLLKEFSTRRLGKDVFDLVDVGYALPTGRVLLDDLNWSIGPGERIGLIGVNGSGKTTLLRLLAGDLAPTAGRVKRGKTLRIGHLTQEISGRSDEADVPADEQPTGRARDLAGAEQPIPAAHAGDRSNSLDDPTLGTRSGDASRAHDWHPERPDVTIDGRFDENDRVLDSVDRLRRQVRLRTGEESSASSLLEDFGFAGERLTTRIGDLSGGERRRLQFLRLLMDEPNVLLLDEPTNDLDIDTLTAIEDYLDSWPGTLMIVSHDRYLLERVCDVIYAVLDDGHCVLLPGGVDEYLARRTRQPETATGSPTKTRKRAKGAGGKGAGTRKGASEMASAPSQGQPDDDTRAANTPDGIAVASGNTGAATQQALSPAALRQARKDLARVEGQLAKLATRMETIHADMVTHAADYEALTADQQSLDQATAEQESLEAQWLSLAESIDG